MTEPERRATEQMLRETSPGATPKPGQPTGPGRDARTEQHGHPQAQTVRTGTHVLPMPATDGDPAGMPRTQRVHTLPGDPGNPAQENQVVGTDAPDSARPAGAKTEDPQAKPSRDVT